MGVHTFAGLTILGLRELHTSKCGRAKHFYQENDKSFFLTIHVSNWQITGFLQSTALFYTSLHPGLSGSS